MLFIKPSLKSKDSNAVDDHRGGFHLDIELGVGVGLGV